MFNHEFGGRTGEAAACRENRRASTMGHVVQNRLYSVPKTTKEWRAGWYMDHDVIKLNAPLTEHKKCHQTVEDKTKKGPTSVWTERSQQIIARLNYTNHNAWCTRWGKLAQISCNVSIMAVCPLTSCSLYIDYVYYSIKYSLFFTLKKTYTKIHTLYPWQILTYICIYT